MTSHICCWCGISFEGNPRNKNKFCSRACTARYASTLTKTVICANCGVEFEGRLAGRGARYCTVKCRNRASYLKNGTPEIRGDRKEYYQDQRYKKYGISHIEYLSMVESQNNSCAICGIDISSDAHIDHDHDTGRVRGILCGKHNMGLGMFDDSKTLLEKALKYLEENS